MDKPNQWVCSHKTRSDIWELIVGYTKGFTLCEHTASTCSTDITHPDTIQSSASAGRFLWLHNEQTDPLRYFHTKQSQSRIRLLLQSKQNPSRPSRKSKADLQPSVFQKIAVKQDASAQSKPNQTRQLRQNHFTARKVIRRICLYPSVKKMTEIHYCKKIRLWDRNRYPERVF